MTTTALHLKVQRSRFLQHALAAVTGAVPALLQALKPAAATRQPAAPARRDAVREAANVRRMAASYMTSDPGFAADLYAAADRHEQFAVH